MKGFAVFVEKDKVILDLGGRRRDILMTCGEAEKFAFTLELGANSADLAPSEVVKGERWEIEVQSYDGRVACRFHAPGPGYPRCVPLPPAMARRLAARVRFKAQQAAYKMRFEFTTSLN